MIDLEFTFERALRAMAERARDLRILLGLRQEELADRAGLGVATVVRFEKTGRTSFENVLRIAVVLGAEEGFLQLFAQPEYETLDEAIAASKPKKRERVRSR